VILSFRDLEIIETLGSRVRMLSAVNLAAAWWNDGASGGKNAAKRLRRLARAGLLRRVDVLAQPMLALGSAEYAWFPAEQPTDFGWLSWRLQSRWSGQPRRTSVYIATSRAVDLIGGGAPGAVKNLCQATHDLHLGAVFLTYRRRWANDAANWVGEDSLVERGKHQKIPDALLINRDGAPYRAVEFGGSYSARRLQAFHEHCRHRGLPYEIW